jgi:hypothetical protein
MAAPLFLLAPPRSYTSVINAMIGQHPQTFGVPELNLFNVDTMRDLWGVGSEDIWGVRHGLLRAVAQIYAGEQTAAAITMAEHWVAAREDRTTGQVFQELAEKIDPLVVVEKSPAYTMSIERLRRIYDAFPEARFIHLVRHPVPQGKSVMGLNNGVFAYFMNSFDFTDDRVVIDPQIAWHDINVNILNFLHMVPKEQQILIRGEEFMEKPEKHLTDVCLWLGIRVDDDAIEEMMHPERSPFACFGPITALCGNDPNFLRGPSFRQNMPNVPPLDSDLPWRDDGKKLYPQVVELAQEFGYR